MLECLACRSRLVQAFQHCEHGFLVCRVCFGEFVRARKSNAFRRLSLLTAEIPLSLSRLQAQLIKFAESRAAGRQGILDFSISHLFQDYIAKEQETQELSTQSSLNGSLYEKEPAQAYSNYAWIKQQVVFKYNQLKDSAMTSKVSQNLEPVREKIAQKQKFVAEGLSYIAEQFWNLKKQAPALRDIKDVDFGGLFRSAYKNLF